MNAAIPPDRFRLERRDRTQWLPVGVEISGSGLNFNRLCAIPPGQSKCILVARKIQVVLRRARKTSGRLVST